MGSNVYFEIPMDIIEKCGPLEEFKQDAAMASVRLKDDRVYNKVLILYPNYIISMIDREEIPFSPDDIVEVYQTEEDLTTRSSADCIFFRYPDDGS